MHVLITARHGVSLTDDQKQLAEDKANKLVKFYDLIQEIEVVVEPGEPVGFHVEYLVNAEHKNTFVANSRCEAVEACIDECFKKLERQLSEHKDRHRNRKHAGADASIRHQPV
jgi:ribosomal subunit interface protein